MQQRYATITCSWRVGHAHQEACRASSVHDCDAICTSMSGLLIGQWLRFDGEEGAKFKKYIDFTKELEQHLEVARFL